MINQEVLFPNLLRNLSYAYFNNLLFCSLLQELLLSFIEFVSYFVLLLIFYLSFEVICKFWMGIGFYLFQIEFFFPFASPSCLDIL